MSEVPPYGPHQPERGRCPVCHYVRWPCDTAELADDVKQTTARAERAEAIVRWMISEYAPDDDFVIFAEDGDDHVNLFSALLADLEGKPPEGFTAADVQAIVKGEQP